MPEGYIHEDDVLEHTLESGLIELEHIHMWIDYASQDELTSIMNYIQNHTRKHKQCDECEHGFLKECTEEQYVMGIHYLMTSLHCYKQIDSKERINRIRNKDKR